MAEPYLLDTSSVIAYLEDEDGADRVEELLRTERTLLPFVTVLEVQYVAIQERGAAIAQERLAGLKALPCVWLNAVDEATLLAAARIKANHHLSFADALVAGFAISHGAVLVHKDPEYEAVSAEVRQERLPYKPRRGRP
jgi:predicted nucleic acid-binding protein